MRFRAAAFLVPVLLAVVASGCTAATGQALVPITVNVSSAAYPWVGTAYACTPSSAAIVISGDPEADIVMRLTEPPLLTGPAFQFGTDDLLVVTHPQVGVGRLTARQVEALFTGELANWSQVGGSDQPVQVWSFAPAVDVQAFFDTTILHGRPVSSLARLAVSAQHMSDSVGATSGAIGILPRRWKLGNTNEILLVSTVPVLALVKEEPRGALAELISCLQAHQ